MLLDPPRYGARPACQIVMFTVFNGFYSMVLFRHYIYLSLGVLNMPQILLSSQIKSTHRIHKRITSRFISAMSCPDAPNHPFHQYKYFALFPCTDHVDVIEKHDHSNQLIETGILMHPI